MESPNKIPLSERHRIAGWTHVPYAKPHSRHPDAVATAIAKRYIALFDRALRDKGYVAVAAVEVEADVVPYEDPPPKPYEPPKRHWVMQLLRPAPPIPPPPPPLVRHGPVARGRVVREIKKINNTEFNYADHCKGARPRIEDCIEETGTRDIEFTTVPARPLATATRVAHIKKNLFEGSYEGFEALTGITLANRTMRDRQGLIKSQENYNPIAVQGLRVLHTSQVRFHDTYDGPYALSHGEHINLSIHDVADAPSATITKKMMTHSTLMKKKRFTQGFGHYLMNYGFHDWALLDSGEASRIRLEQRYTDGDGPIRIERADQGDGPAFCLKHGEDTFSLFRVQGMTPSRRRMELRLPDAECNPYLAMLYSMAHLYSYMQAYEADPKAAEQGNAPLDVPAYPATKFLSDLQLRNDTNHFKPGSSVVLAKIQEVGKLYGLDGMADAQALQEAVQRRKTMLDRSPQPHSR